MFGIRVTQVFIGWTTLIALAACASTTPIITTSGTLPTSGGFALLGHEGEPFAGLIERRLLEQGLQSSDAPDYLIQVARSERSASTGAIVAGGAEQSWLRAPSAGKSRRRLATLVITVSEKATGRELYRASVTAPSGDTFKEPEAMIRAVLPRNGAASGKSAAN